MVVEPIKDKKKIEALLTYLKGQSDRELAAGKISDQHWFKNIRCGKS